MYLCLWVESRLISDATQVWGWEGEGGGREGRRRPRDGEEEGGREMSLIGGFSLDYIVRMSVGPPVADN